MADKQPDDFFPSKSQRKKIALELQDLGKKLTSFKSRDLDRLPLPEKLKSAISEFSRLPNSRGARKRQLQYIGKIMRGCDKQEIEQAIFRLDPFPKQDKSNAELIFQLSNLLIQKGDKGISEILDSHTSFDRQKLRQLYREFNKEQESRRTLARKKIENYIASALA